MKIADAIKELQEIFEEHGDLELVGLVKIDGHFAIDWDRELAVIELNTGPDGSEEKVAALSMAFELSAKPSKTTVHPPATGRSMLSIVKPAGDT